MSEWTDALRAICRERCAFYGDPPCFQWAAEADASPCFQCLGYEEAREQAAVAIEARAAFLRKMGAHDMADVLDEEARLARDMLPEEG